MVEKIFTEQPTPIPVLKDEIKLFFNTIPNKPGVYRFLDKSGYPLYIGKAKSLKNRLMSYFRVSARTKKIQNAIIKKLPVVLNQEAELEKLAFQRLSKNIIKAGENKHNGIRFFSKS